MAGFDIIDIQSSGFTVTVLVISMFN